MRPTPSSVPIIAHIDGGSRGNPGPAACAVVLSTLDGVRVAAFSKHLGRATNNVAEYEALLAVLRYALENRRMQLRVKSDSELLVRQIQGLYKVKSPDLKPLHERALESISQLQKFEIEHVPREENREADGLVNEELDRGVERPVAAASLPSPDGLNGVDPLRTRAIYRKGAFQPHRKLPLDEGEEVELEIRRRK